MSNSYDNDVILGAKIERLVASILQKHIDGGLVTADAVNDLKARLESVEKFVTESNIGERVADSLDAQTLKVEGLDVAEALDDKIGNVVAAAGANIGSVGTPTVTVVNDKSQHKSTLTFNYLKGAKGDTGAQGEKGDKGDKGDTGSWGGTVDQTYDSQSKNPQSGTAVAGAISSALPTSGNVNKKYSIDIAGCADKNIYAYAYTTSQASSQVKVLSFISAFALKSGSLIAVKFNNGNSYSSGQLYFRINDHEYRVNGTGLYRIASGETYLFVIPLNTQTDVYLVGKVYAQSSLSLNSGATLYEFNDNIGGGSGVKVYPYQSPTGKTDTFYSTAQTKTNGTGSPTTKMFNVSSGGASLNWAQPVESRYDFVDICVRVVGDYTSDYANPEIITFEPYKNDGNSVSVAGLPELSHYLLLVNDGVLRPFAFTLNMRMHYKEFLSRIGGQGTTLNYGFSFAGTTSSSAKHSVTVQMIWTSVVYHGDYS